MNVLPPFLLVLDITALMAGRTRDWQQFSKLGDCYVPKVVLQEIESLCAHAPEPELEQVAREFARFYPTSGWRETQEISTHSALKAPEGHALSNRARVALTVAQTAYGMARKHADGLVILVANDQGLLKRLPLVELPNLCGIPFTVLVNWVRSQRKPDAVIHHVQLMRTNEVPRTLTSAVSKPSRSSTPLAQPAVPQPKRPSQSPRPVKHRSLNFTQVFYNLLTVALVVAIALVIWRIASPASFDNVWKQLPISSQRPMPSKK
jgi:hypothetical protein